MLSVLKFCMSLKPGPARSLPGLVHECAPTCIALNSNDGQYWPMSAGRFLAEMSEMIAFAA